MIKDRAKIPVAKKNSKKVENGVKKVVFLKAI